MPRLKLIYDNYAEWEKDYIHELLSNLTYDTIYVDRGNLTDRLPKENEIVNNNILLFSSNIYKFEQIKKIILRLKPLVIIHLSDEFGMSPEYSVLASYTKLLLHQYNFKHYPREHYNNTIQIPLGYMTGMFNGKKPFNIIKPVAEKKYKWSFIGNIKNDRKEMTLKFSEKFSENFTLSNVKPPEMFNVYNDSIFVPVGRGNVVVDCFRIYEAILSGSIPIIVCQEKEFNESFHFNGDIPPFIFEKTWSDAANKCESLLKDPENVKSIAEKNYIWLQRKIKSIQDKIHLVIKSCQV